MSDDRRQGDEDDSASRRRPGSFESDMDSFDPDEFGGPLFGDDSGGSRRAPVTGAAGEGTGLSFGDDRRPTRRCSSTGRLPRWSLSIAS